MKFYYSSRCPLFIQQATDPVRSPTVTPRVDCDHASKSTEKADCWWSPPLSFHLTIYEKVVQLLDARPGLKCPTGGRATCCHGSPPHCWLLHGEQLNKLMRTGLICISNNANTIGRVSLWSHLNYPVLQSSSRS